jgi:hypothetical protein
MDYSDVSQSGSGNVKFGGVSTEYAAAAIVIGALIALILLRRGFRGVSIPGVGSVSAS